MFLHDVTYICAHSGLSVEFILRSCMRDGVVQTQATVPTTLDSIRLSGV